MSPEPGPAAHPANSVPPIAVDASAAEIIAAASRIRAGRVLTPSTWKDGAKVAVCLTFDVDNEFPQITSTHARPVALSWGEYGATTGLPRILRTMAKHQVPGSFYIPAGSAILHPRSIEEIIQPGIHEIGVHGWTHEHIPSLANAGLEHELLRRAIEHLTAATGTRPVGYRAPSWDFGPETLHQIIDEGFAYDSSMMAMDQPYEVLADGAPTGLVELPVHWVLDDVPYFGVPGGGAFEPDAAFRVLRREFDVAYDEGTLLVVTFHPMISGLRSRAAALDEFIAYMQSKPSVWFATMQEVADYVRQESGLSPR